MRDLPNFDVLIVGGGIHGVGVAQASAAAGFQVALLEQSSLAAGTSSKSSKLIHGGLRYLESFELSLVRESLRERELLIRLAPGLVTRKDFLIPIYANSSRRPWKVHAGLALYSLLAGFRPHVRYSTVAPDLWKSLDGLSTDGLEVVFRYPDAQTDDLLLTESVMRSAQSLGATLFCPTEFCRAVQDKNGWQVEYQFENTTGFCHAGVIVNAAGPWANHVLQRLVPQQPTFAVEMVQGTHLELPGKVKHGCYYLEVPSDQRAVFVMPWRDHTLLGTTEHVYHGDPAKVRPLDQEQDYLLDMYQKSFPVRDITVLKAWSGLRVLPTGGNAFRRSRETQLPADNERQPRVVSIFGGKLTGYRATSQKVLNKLLRTLPRRQPIARTDELKLS